MIKTCIKCGFIGENILFAKGTNICKKCKAIYDKQIRKINNDCKNKICNKCKIIKNNDLFEKGLNICKECRKEQRNQCVKNQKGKEKNCQKCKFIGDSSLFGLGNICKECLKKEAKQRIQNKKDGNKTCSKCNFVGDSKLFGPGNICKICLNKQKKQRIENQKDKQKTCNKCKFIGNSCLFEPGLNICKKCIRKAKNKRKKERKENDPKYNLRCEISIIISKALKKRGLSKQGLSFLKYVDYTIEELFNSIESKFEWWMTWENHGIYDPKTWDDNDPSTWRWQLDHIIPKSDFNYTSPNDPEFKECWSLKNLRPLSAKQNILDGVNRTRHIKK